MTTLYQRYTVYKLFRPKDIKSQLVDNFVFKLSFEIAFTQDIRSVNAKKKNKKKIIIINRLKWEPKAVNKNTFGYFRGSDTMSGETTMSICFVPF